MPRSKLGKKRPAVDAASLERAVEAVTSDNGISLREACKVFKVSLATLSRHLKKFKESGGQVFQYFIKLDVKKVFTEAEEISLVDYIKNIARMQYGLSKKCVRELAYKFAKANNKNVPPNWNKNKIAGEEWMRWFMKRHNNIISVRKPEATSLSRSTSFNENNVNKFFNNLEDVHHRFGPIPPERIWNTDETGLTTVQKPIKILAPKGEKQVGSVTSAERGQLVTLIAAVNAIGNHIPPMLIFPRVNFKDFMLSGAPPGTIGGANPSGWSTEALFLEFLKHFASHVKPSRDQRVLLLMDNHETHLSVEAVEYAYTEGIVMLTFPPHTSHKFQPLDLSVYGPLQTFYGQSIDAWLRNNPGKTFTIYCIAEALGKAYPRAFTTSNIVSGFKKPGIYPFDRGVFSEQDFMVSYVTDRPNEISPGIPPTSNCDTHPRPEPIPGPSCRERTPSPIPSNSTFISPELVCPYPKAAPRKNLRKGRKPGDTRIVTDTPEMEEIKQRKQGKASRSNKKTKQKASRKVKRQVFDSDSDDESGEVLLNDDSDSDVLIEEITNFEEEEQFISSSYAVGDFVLVQFPKKKGLPEHYIGKIISKELTNSEFKIEFYRRVRSGSNKFVKESDQIYDVNDNDLVMKLPPPVPMTGSGRLAGRFWFQIDFEKYNEK